MTPFDTLILLLFIAAAASAWTALCIALAARDNCTRCPLFNRCANEELPTVDEPDERPDEFPNKINQERNS